MIEYRILDFTIYCLSVSARLKSTKPRSSSQERMP